MNKTFIKLFSGFDFEKETLFYKKIGVISYKNIVPTAGDYWIRLINKTFSKNIKIIKKRDDAVVWTIFTIGIEGLHTLGFWFINYFIADRLLHQSWNWVVILIVLNIFINFYPILTQR